MYCAAAAEPACSKCSPHPVRRNAWTCASYPAARSCSRPTTSPNPPQTGKVVTEREPTDAELADLTFAWKAAKHIKSNTIVLAKDNTLVGMGAGQPNRVVSVHLALRIAEDKAKGSVLASDAFFPFADNIEMAASGGITAIAEPGGSIRDDEVIAAANEHNIAMLFTGSRHFRH